MAGLIVVGCCLALLVLALYTLACSPWPPTDRSAGDDAPRWTADNGWTPNEPPLEQSGLRLMRGTMYGCGASAVLVLGVLAILWWAL